MAAALVAVRVVRPMRYKGQTHFAGEIIVCSPTEAFALTSTNRCELATAGDRAAVQAAGREEQARLLAKAGRVGPAPRDGPWLPL